MSERLMVAVPSEGGGLDARRSGHFGRAPAFTLVSVEGRRIVAARDVVNPPHEPGGCLRTVGLLIDAGVTTAVVGGIGGGPFNRLDAAGVDIYHDDTHATVREAVEALLGEGLPRVGPGGACSHAAHGDHHHGSS